MPCKVTVASVALLVAALGSSACHRNPFGSGGNDDDGQYDLAVPPDMNMAMVISPQNPVLVIGPGTKLATQQFTATIDGTAVSATWATDRTELGGVLNNGVYTTVGNFGGTGKVTATYNGVSVATNVIVQYNDVGTDGDPACLTLTDGAFGPGGYGGVGGDGPGCATTDAQKATLAGTATADPSIKWLYPYDATIFPRAQFAPLLMWNPGTHTFDSIRLQMTSKSGSYVFDGTYSKPPGTANHPPAGVFQNFPIPQDKWEQMNLSSSGDEIDISVSFAEGTNLFGPVTVSWVIAAGDLKGTVYYNSYGTKLVTNSGEPDYNGKQAAAMGVTIGHTYDFGAATLAIHSGNPNPTLVAGKNSTDMSGCRVCHSVTRDGSRLFTQKGDNGYNFSAVVNLLSAEGPYVESTPAPTTQNLAFSAPSPDGTMLFSSSNDSNGMRNADKTSNLYALPSATPMTTNMPTDLQASLPSFSPDGKQIAFNWYGGAGSDAHSLATMTFDGVGTFGAVTKLVTPEAGAIGVWPTFLPAIDGVVYEAETSGAYGTTWNGAHGTLWWVDLATKTPTRLAMTNGDVYLPTNDKHTDDQEMNYEPTVNPVPSGGYAWVVFTSRRLYGNVATQDPYLSDPRNYDWTKNITTKKLWVAAIDLSPKAGKDPSHPAFYLPAQELYAGNSRGYWTVDPCASDGSTCETGDQCCGGYCSPASMSSDAGGAAYVCGSVKPVCANLYEKCVADVDCCQPAASIDSSGQNIPTCINGYCSAPNPPPIL